MTRTPPPKGAKRTGDWIGRHVRTLKAITTGMAEIPIGTRCVVTGICNGLELRASACSCCNVRLRVTRVPSSWVQEIDPSEPLPQTTAQALMTELQRTAEHINPGLAYVDAAVLDKLAKVLAYARGVEES